MQARQKVYTHLISTLGFLALVWTTSHFVYLNYFSTWSDAAGYVSLFESVKNKQGMVSPMYNAGTWFFEIDKQTDFSTWCSLPSVNRFENFSRWHPYLAIYPLAFISKISGISSLALLSFLTAVSYLLVPFIAFHYLRGKTNYSNIKVIFLVCAMVSVPAWSGGLEGQIQADRFFIVVGFLVTLLLLEGTFFPSKNSTSRIWIITLLTIFGILISERSAVYLASIFTVILIQASRLRNRALLIQIGSLMVLCVSYFLYWKMFIEDSSYYGRTSLSYFLRNMEISFTSQLRSSVIFFLAVSLLLFFASGNTLSFSLALVLLLPQFIWSTGGSEKVGFITQYHAGYIGPLIACATFGVAATSTNMRLNLPKEIHKISVKFTVAILYILLMITSNFWTPNLGHQMNPLQLYRNLGFDVNSMNSLDAAKRFKVDFIRQIPSNSWISAPEYFMPALTYSKQHNVDYFPFGLRYNSYAIFTYESENMQVISPWLNYILPEDKPERGNSISKCITYTLLDSKVINSVNVGNTRYDLVKLSPKDSYVPYP